MDFRMIHIHAVNITATSGQGTIVLPPAKKGLNVHNRPVALTAFCGLGQGADRDSRDEMPRSGRICQLAATHQNRGALTVTDPAKLQAGKNGLSPRVVMGAPPHQKETRHEMD